VTENHLIRRIARMPALAVMRGSVVALLLAAWSPGLAAATDFDRLYQDGQAARQAGDHAAAERLFGEALALQPDNADVLLFLGLVQGYQQKGGVRGK